MKNIIKFVLLFTIAAACFYVSFAFAEGAATVSGVATNITKSFGSLAKLITGGSFVAGLGFAVAAILKFKAHRDNPTQIPVGTPIALLFIAVSLLFLPVLFKGVGSTAFGSGAKSGSVSGVVSI